MSGSGAPLPARAVAARVVDLVVGAGRTLDAALLEVRGAGDARVRALCYGALRWHYRHRAILRLLLERPLPGRADLVNAALSVALFELDDAREPDYAVVSAAVDAVRVLGHERMAAVANAVLRRWLRERAQSLPRLLAQDEEARWSSPAWLVRAIATDWPAEADDVLAANLAPPPLWLRVNLLRGTAAALQDELAAAGLPSVASPALPEALRLERAVPVTAIPGFAAGAASVQDLGSQFAAPLLAPEPGMRVLDACAAPGGKATHLLESAGGPLDLLALDVDDARLGRLRDNLARLGLAATVRAGDALRPGDWWDGRPFDRILLDAPCSGTGVIRRHPDIRLLRREADMAPLAARQGQLLDALWPLLRPGGRLLYATCSVLRAENTAVVAAFQARRPEMRPVAPPDGVLRPGLARPDGPGWQLLPAPAGPDGLYYALMERGPA